MVRVECNGGSLKGGAKALMLLLPARRSDSLQSSVLTVLDHDEVNVSLKNVEFVESVLSGEGGSANGWRCC